MAENKAKHSGRIPAAQVPPLKSWNLPRVSGAHVVRSPFKERHAQQPAPEPVEPAPETVPQEQQLSAEALEEIRQQARDEGYQQGYQEGLEQGQREGRVKGEELGFQSGLQRGEDQINAQHERLGALIKSLQRPLAKQQQELEAALLRLVIDTAATVVKQELASRRELLQQTVSDALAALPHGEPQLRISVHPDDLALLEEVREREHGEWSLRADPSMLAGGVVIQGANSYLDYSVEGRFSQVAQQLLAAPVGGSDAAGSAARSGSYRSDSPSTASSPTDSSPTGSSPADSSPAGSPSQDAADG